MLARWVVLIPSFHSLLIRCSSQMVVIVDPHLKRVDSYPVYKEATELDVLSKTKDGNEYEGWCWSGSSAWVDFFNPASWDWWKGLFKTVQGSAGKFAWTESTTDVHIWNDMNEVCTLKPLLQLC